MCCGIFLSKNKELKQDAGRTTVKHTCLLTYTQSNVLFNKETSKDVKYSMINVHTQYDHDLRSHWETSGILVDFTQWFGILSRCKEVKKRIF